MFGPKIQRRHQRREMLKQLFDAHVSEFPEDNLPTHIASFLADALAAMPNSARECDVEGLFDRVLHEWR